MTEIIFIVEESPEGGYEARALDQSIFTDGDTIEELRQNVREAFIVILRLIPPRWYAYILCVRRYLQHENPT